ncbi:MAG: Ldh family oxidoreductase, partial [Pseudomonadota bacterium]
MVEVSVQDIRTRSAEALVAHGAGTWQANEVARAVARAEETGNIICGLYYLESYCRQLVSGRVVGTVEPVVARPKPGVVTVNARFGFAQPAFSRALPRAVGAASDATPVSRAAPTALGRALEKAGWANPKRAFTVT